MQLKKKIIGRSLLAFLAIAIALPSMAHTRTPAIAHPPAFDRYAVVDDHQEGEREFIVIDRATLRHFDDVSRIELPAEPISSQLETRIRSITLTTDHASIDVFPVSQKLASGSLELFDENNLNEHRELGLKTRWAIGNVRARWYDPSTGTFLTPDPMGYQDSSNLYAFAGGDPVNGRDPTGEQTAGQASRKVGNKTEEVLMTTSVGMPPARFELWGALTVGSRLAMARALKGGLAVMEFGEHVGNAIDHAAHGEFDLALQEFTTDAANGLVLYGAAGSLGRSATNRLVRAPQVSPPSPPPVVEPAPVRTVEAPSGGYIGPERQLAAPRELPVLDNNIAVRSARDVAVNPRPRPAKTSGGIGKSSTQHQAMLADLAEAQRLQASDIRVNQQMVNAGLRRVGINRPDLQFTLNGKRYYIEYDTPASGRGLPHQVRILQNDANAVVILKIVP